MDARNSLSRRPPGAAATKARAPQVSPIGTILGRAYARSADRIVSIGGVIAKAIHAPERQERRFVGRAAP